MTILQFDRGRDWRDSARCSGITLDEAEQLLREYIAPARRVKLQEEYVALRRRVTPPEQQQLPSIARPKPHPLWHLVYWNPKAQGYDDGYEVESDAHMAEWRALLFFPSERSDGSAEALRYAAPAAVCEACPVRSTCLAENLHEQLGVYGGLSQERRRKLRRTERRAS